MTDPLAPLLAEGVIDEVVARLKSGKEADVWLVRHGSEVVAAKVYKARHARSFKNNAAYKEGRQVRNTRTQRAMDRGSRFGQEAAEDAWKATESNALYRLHAAGVRVPRPVLFLEGILLMELVVDADGRPAPRLVDAQLSREQAAPMYADIRRQAVGMLACDLIHGDLSPYNVLLGVNGPVIIDLPQVIGAAHNSQGETFFLRDLQNIQRHFAALDPTLRSAEGDGREIWRAYVRRELTADFVPTGRPEPQRKRESHESHRREAQRGAQGQRQHGGRPVGQHHGAHAMSEARAQPAATPSGSRARPARPRPSPDVIRVVRLDRPPHGGGGGGSAGAAGAAPRQAVGPGGRRRRRRRHR